ncbi:MAG TPA: hypothetical protein VGR55_16210 [Candidatus Acidoferrum sp.]|nr:hypothetical protein [Candidatus Acidoferrum sp.]
MKTMDYPALRAWRILWIVIAILASFSVFGASTQAQITMQVFVNPHPQLAGGTIGFTFAGAKFVGSVAGDGSGILYSTDLNGGNVQIFAPSVTLPGNYAYDEHVVVASLGLGGFPLWDIYVATGVGVLHITNDGTQSNMFANGLASPVRGMMFDGVGTFGHDLLVSTQGGQIYRVNSSGLVTLVTSVGEDIEGMDIAPLGAGFGGFDGQVVTAAGNSGLLRAIDPSGKVTVLNANNPIFQPERLAFVPLNIGASGSPLEGLYSANYPLNVVKASASQFLSFKGDAIVMTELGDQRVSRVHWDGSSFQITAIGSSSGEAEDGFFLGPNTLNAAVCQDPRTHGRPVEHDNLWCAPFCRKGGVMRPLI